MSRSRVSGLLVLGVAAILARATAETADSSKAPTQTPNPAAAKPAAPAAPIAPVTAPVFKLDQLTKTAFDKLPENALLDMQGRRLPKSEFITERKKALAEVSARLQAAAGTELAGFQAEVQRLDAAEVERETAKVRAEVTKLRASSGNVGAPGDLNALRRAAIDLKNRYKTASLTERIEIEKQAADLLKKVREMKK